MLADRSLCSCECTLLQLSWRPPWSGLGPEQGRWLRLSASDAPTSPGKAGAGVCFALLGQFANLGLSQRKKSGLFLSLSCI